MKKALLVIGVLSFSFVSAQTNRSLKSPRNNFGRKYFYNSNNRRLGSLTEFEKNAFELPKAKFSLTSSQNTKIRISPVSPLDSRLAMEADFSILITEKGGIPIQFLKKFQKSHPLVFRKLPGQIPNAVTPYYIIPQRKDNTTR